VVDASFDPEGVERSAASQQQDSQYDDACSEQELAGMCAHTVDAAWRQ
jgi:hypothetical protein